MSVSVIEYVFLVFISVFDSVGDESRFGVDLVSVLGEAEMSWTMGSVREGESSDWGGRGNWSSFLSVGIK